MFGLFRPVHYLNHAWATKIAHGERLRGPVSRGIAKCHNPAHPGLDLVCASAAAVLGFCGREEKLRKGGDGRGGRGR